jgi:hypothetical protein
MGPKDGRFFLIPLIGQNDSLRTLDAESRGSREVEPPIRTWQPTALDPE